MNLREEVLSECKKLGADIAGIAPVERFINAPIRMSPLGLLPSAKSVIVAGIHHPDACIELSGEPSPHDIGPYRAQGTMNSKLDDISFLTAKFLEKKGYASIPVAASNIWRYKGYKDLKVDFAPDIVHRYAAAAAGLGEIGWNGLFLTNEYGPRQRVVSIVTEADIEPDPMYEGPPTCDKCMACVKACPTDAFRKEVKGENRVEIGSRVFKFPDTNKWRCSWAENFCLSLEHQIPGKVDEDVCLEYLEKYGYRGGEVGSCLRFCMSPGKRYYDKAYTRAPRRKKEITPRTNEEICDEVKRICSDNCMDVFAVAAKDQFDDNPSINPVLHLPDVQSVIVIGTRVRDEWKKADQVAWSTFAGEGVCGKGADRMLDYASFEITRYFDLSGYSAVCDTKLPADAAAEAAGIQREDYLFSAILTSASVPAVKKEIKNQKKGGIDKPALKKLCLEAGCDVTGVFSVERFDEFLNSGFKKETGEKWAVEDKGFMYGAYFPRIKREEFKILRPQDWLASAKSVIVAGLHFPDAPLDYAKITPAEAVGPFAFVSYETLFLLREAAFKIIRRLDDNGAKAVFTDDLSGTASRISSSRGKLPDFRSNMYEAVLAGLAYPGVHGYPITPEFGVRQRFIAIVTDIELESDPLYTGKQLCCGCSEPCIPACPTGALKKSSEDFDIKGAKFLKPSVDCFACDWAKMYNMSGKEGARYCGLDINEPVPPERTPEQTAKSISAVKWGMQKRHINVVEECLRACPAGKKENHDA